jgi:hypothetical protein
VEWSDIALPIGSPDQGYLGLQLRFVLPLATNDLAASGRQSEAVRFFYEQDFGPLSASQAHTLLACREFSRLCSDSIFKTYSFKVRNLIARGIAAYVLTEPEILNYVIGWSERNFDRGVSAPRVKGTPYFIDVFNFASYLDGMLEMNGWNKSQLKSI